MAKPRKINLFRETKELAESFINGNRNATVAQALRPGPCRAILPAMVHNELLKSDKPKAQKWLNMCLNEVAR